MTDLSPSDLGRALSALSLAKSSPESRRARAAAGGRAAAKRLTAEERAERARKAGSAPKRKRNA